MNREKRGSRLYSKTDGDAGDKISYLIGVSASELAKVSRDGKISLSDTATVQAKTVEYLHACEETGVLPSKIGLARACGVSRQAVDSFMSHNPGHSTTEYFQIIFDCFSEVLSNAAMIGGVHPIFSMFLEKAIYGYKEACVIEMLPSNPLGQEPDVATIVDRYKELPED